MKHNNSCGHCGGTGIEPPINYFLIIDGEKVTTGNAKRLFKIK